MYLYRTIRYRDLDSVRTVNSNEYRKINTKNTRPSAYAYTALYGSSKSELRKYISGYSVKTTAYSNVVIKI